MRRWGAGMATVALAAGLGARAAALATVPPSVLAEAEARLAAGFAAREVAYPPRAVTLIALKSEARLELWADAGDGWRFVRSYLVQAASGRLGPKLREGDHQVPEGVYRIDALNPESRYHLSLRLDYPSAFDRARAGEDGRTRLGGDIMIHGGSVSDGCLPVGDREVEELFALTARIGTEHVEVVISPADLRRVDAGVAYTRATARPGGSASSTRRSRARSRPSPPPRTSGRPSPRGGSSPHGRAAGPATPWIARADARRATWRAARAPACCTPEGGSRRGTTQAAPGSSSARPARAAMPAAARRSRSST